MATPLEGTESAKDALARVHYTHDAVIDLIIAQPGASQGELAKVFGYTEAWLSRVINSDAFQARLAARRTELCDPALVASIEERFKGVVTQSLDIIAEKLEKTRNVETAFQALELGAKALGYGARKDQVGIQNNFVVHIPAKAESSEAWATANRPNGVAAPILDQDD